MLSREENALLTESSADKPLGHLMRRYWIPALLSAEIPEPDCPPVRVRLLGEDLVAFRDTQGRTGLLGEHCSHRGTSLFFARNEESGLRCIYHGWKFDISGTVLETPAEPAESTLRHKVRHTAYPCAEAAGIVWAYLGPKDKMPLLPAYEWMSLPPDHLYVTKSIQDCNWLQGLEGECDSSHLSILHKAFSQTKRGGGDPDMYAADSAPMLEGMETDYGVRMISCRKADGDTLYVRVSNMVLPCHGFVPTGGLAGNAEGYTIHSHVPIDDAHSMRYNIHFRRNRPICPEERQHDREINPSFRKLRNLANDYLQDREEQQHETFTGMGRVFLTHDSCATESMGPIYDRSQEHLGVSDITVIAVRKFLLKCITSIAAGKEPPHLVHRSDENDQRHIACIVAKIPITKDPKAFIAEQLKRNRG